MTNIGGAPDAATAAADEITVSILVISYNTREMTLDCLESVVEKTRDVKYEIVVLDNASTDGSVDAIAAWMDTRQSSDAQPRMRLVRRTDNLGFGRGNNVAAAEASGDYLLLLNPDTRLLDDAVSAIVAFARRRPGARIWGGRTLFEDGRLNPTSCWGDPTLWSLLCDATGLTLLFPRSETFNPNAYGAWQRDREREVDIVTGCFLLIERAFWEELGGFDPDFFMYSEEADLCRRARQRGALPAITPEATLIHHGAASERIFGPKVVRLYKSKATYFRKHWSGWRCRLGCFLIELRALGRATGFAVAARLTGRDRYRASSADWWHVWQHRREWRKGY